MVALRFLTDDSDLDRDLEKTERELSRLLSARPTSEVQAATIAQQVEACRHHLVVQRAHVVSRWFGLAASVALEHGDALKRGRA